MKTKLVMGAMVASMIMAGCGSSNNSTTAGTNTSGMNSGGQTQRFTKMTMMGDTVRQDNNTKLEWVGSAGNSACAPHQAATTEASDIAMAKAHCEALDFAGHTDWRVATPSEHAMFITGMKEAGITPFYANPACPRLIGVNGSTATAVNTHNSTPVGGLTPWATLLQQTATNYGVKCVRNF